MPEYSVIVNEEQRQILLLAMAQLSIERPGWDAELNTVAMKFDRQQDGRAVLYDLFRNLLATDQLQVDAQAAG